MAASRSSDSSNSLRSCLILNLGVQDIRWRSPDGRFVLIGGPRADPSAVSLLGAGLRKAASTLAARGGLDDIHFPIAARAVEYAGTPLDRILLIATHSDPVARVPDPTANDTFHAAELMKRWLEETGASSTVEIIELKDQPHLFESADLQIGLFFDRLPKFDRVYACVSPGLPMVNLAIFRNGQRIVGQSFHPFQVQEAPQNELEAGGISGSAEDAPLMRVFDESAAILVRQFLDRFDYPAALSVAKTLSVPPESKRPQAMQAIEEALRYWTLEAFRPTGFDALIKRMWVSTYQLDAWIGTDAVTEAVWRAGDVSLKLAEIAYCHAAGDAFLALEREDVQITRLPQGIQERLSDPDNRGVVKAAEVTAAARKAADHRNPAAIFGKKMDSAARDLREVRNKSVHHFVPVSKTDYDRACARIGCTPPGLGSWLRKSILELYKSCGLDSQTLEPIQQIPSFGTRNAEIRRLLEDR